MKLLVLSLIAFASTASAQTVAPPVTSSTNASAPATTDTAAHDALRAMKDRLVAAVNAKQPDAVLAELAPDVRLTTMDNELSKTPAWVHAYYDRMMSGANRIVDEMSLTAQPDELSLLFAGNTVAVTTGTALAHFKLAAGKQLDVPLRWTATSVNRDGKWQVEAAQFSANMFDNPLVAEAKRFAIWIAAGGVLIGLLVGWLLGRRTKRA